MKSRRPPSPGFDQRMSICYNWETYKLIQYSIHYWTFAYCDIRNWLPWMRGLVNRKRYKSRGSNPPSKSALGLRKANKPTGRPMGLKREEEMGSRASKLREPYRCSWKTRDVFCLWRAESEENSLSRLWSRLTCTGDSAWR